MEHNVWFQEELQLNHEPSLNHWAHLLAEDEMENRKIATMGPAQVIL